MSRSVPEVALMPRLLRMISSSSGMMWVEWNSALENLSSDSKAFFTTGLVVEQMDKAIRTSPRWRLVSLKLEVLFLIFRIGSRTVGAMRSTSSGIRQMVLRAFKNVEEVGERKSVLRPTMYFLPILRQALGRLPEWRRFSAAMPATRRSFSEMFSSFMSNLMRSGTSGVTAPFLRSTRAR